MVVFLVSAFFFFLLRLIYLVLNIVYNAAFFCFLMILQKPVLLEVSCEAVNSRVTRHLVGFVSWLFSIAIHLLFHFTVYLLYLTQTIPCPNYSDRVAQKMGKRKRCLAARYLPAVLLGLHSLSGYARQFFSHYIAKHVRWRQF